MQEEKKSDFSFDCTPMEASQASYKKQFVVNGKAATMIAFMSVYSSKQYLRFVKEEMGYRQSFVQMVFDMYSRTEADESEHPLTIDDFVSASDDELSAIMEFILGKDDSLKKIFDEVEATDIFERFFESNRIRKVNLDEGLAESFKNIRTAIGSTFLNTDSTLQIQTTIQAIQAATLPLESAMIPLQPTISSLQSIIAPMQSVLSRLAFDLNKIAFPFAELGRDIAALNNGVMRSLSKINISSFAGILTIDEKQKNNMTL